MLCCRNRAGVFYLKEFFCRRSNERQHWTQIGEKSWQRLNKSHHNSYPSRTNSTLVSPSLYLSFLRCISFTSYLYLSFSLSIYLPQFDSHLLLLLLPSSPSISLYYHISISCSFSLLYFSFYLSSCCSFSLLYFSFYLSSCYSFSLLYFSF